MNEDTTKGAAGVSPTSAAEAMHQKRYSLVTALCMIIGICIGSGIYFKADNVLIATGGSVELGVAMFCIASAVIVFGGLALSVYAARSEGTGGVLAYADEYLPRPLARIFSWNFAILYLPGIAAVLCWVVGVYACMVFGLAGSFAQQMLIGVVYLLFCAAWNVLAPRLAGWFQNVTTFIKILPLLAVGAAGVVFGVAGWGGTAPGLGLGWTGATATAAATAAGAAPTHLGWLLAAAPIAFSFDGWTISASIAPELKNARRNLPIALSVAPLVILALYLLYFIGLSTMLGPATVMEAGDASLGLFFARLFGSGAQTLPNVVALISVMGTVNGVVLSAMRMPYALAQRGDIPGAAAVGRVNGRLGFPVASAIVGVALSLFWMAAHAAVTMLGLLPNGDISELAVSFNMLLTAVLLLRVLGLPVGEGGALRGRVAPVIAALGCVFVASSGLMEPVRWAIIGFYALVLAGFTIWRAHAR